MSETAQTQSPGLRGIEREYHRDLNRARINDNHDDIINVTRTIIEFDSLISRRGSFILASLRTQPKVQIVRQRFSLRVLLVCLHGTDMI